MSTAQLSLNLSALSLQVQLEDVPLAAVALRAVWGHTERVRYVEPSIVTSYEVRSEGSGFRLVMGEQGSRYVTLQEDVTPTLERALYDDCMAAHAQVGLTVLHAACCALNGMPLVFAGVSGAGKSALAQAAVLAGLAYVADEHVVTDGRRIWGIPRNIHQDIHPEQQALSPWHAHSDLASYRCRSASDVWYRLPLIRVADNKVATQALTLAGGTLVALERGEEDTLQPLHAAEKVRLLESCHFVRGPGLADAALQTRGVKLQWRNPERALSLLLRELSRHA